MAFLPVYVSDIFSRLCLSKPVIILNSAVRAKFIYMGVRCHLTILDRQVLGFAPTTLFLFSLLALLTLLDDGLWCLMATDEWWIGVARPVPGDATVVIKTN